MHELNALLLLALLRRFGVRPLVAAAVASAWALLPRLAEAAAWISGRTDVIATMFVLGALLAWGESLLRRGAAGVLLLAGLLSKESAVALVTALAVLEWQRGAGAARAARFRSVAWRLAPLGLALVAYLGLRRSAVGLHVSEDGLGAGLRAATVLDSVTAYSLMLLDPLRPRALIGRLGLVRPWGVVAGAVIVCGCSSLVLRTRRRWTPATYVGLALAFGALVPVLHVIPVPFRVLAADRFLYLPAAGLAVALGPVLDRWLARRRPAWLAVAGAVLVLGAGSSRRVGVWSDELEFWVQTYLETPSINCSAATNLIGVFFRAGQYLDALALSKREAAYDDPEKRENHFNAALCLARLGRSAEALEELRLLDTKKHKDDVELQIATIEIQAGHGSLARARLEPLARVGQRAARTLLARLPDLERASAALPRVPERDALERARLATFLGEDAIAVPAWLAATGAPDATRSTFEEALSYLVRTGDHDAIAMVARRCVARFGALAPKLAAIVAVRLDEIERVQAVRPRLGL
jgi:tetratricopeptide (TPR) repeat protein